MLYFSKRQDTLGLYWDNVEKRVFWTEVVNGSRETKEGPLSFVPKFGVPLKTTPLTFNTISLVDSLIDTFDRIEDILYQASFSPEKRYEIIPQSKRDVVQTFYMKFAKALYKWDMAQYFTPTTVTDFLVEIINPQFGENVADPACGSADFLVAAFRIARKYNPGFADCIWGIENSSNAVQVAVLNMLLNGDGKTNVIKDDSLENIDRYIEKYDILTCNPPFGTKILEKRPKVLRQYDLGFEWIINEEGILKKTETLLPQQETGILFIEVCVKECRPDGRIAIILPNGYLGNRSLIGY